MKVLGHIAFENRLDSTEVFTNPELAPFLRGALKKFPIVPGNVTGNGAGSQAGSHQEPFKTYWEPEFFGLPSLSLYQKLSPGDQQKVLWHCNRLALEEAFYIEKSGMTYAAKMALLADSNDKRALYSLFCADEASHFHAINSFMLQTPGPYTQQKFLVMLDHLIHEGSFNVLVYMIQIILEGWGLQHYRSLAAGCRDASLTEVLRAIIHDEAKHHGSGLVILPQGVWTERDSAICLPILADFIDLVRVGPTSRLLAVESVLGPLSLGEKKSLFNDLKSPQVISESLAFIRNFVVQHGPNNKMIETLLAKPVWNPLSAHEFAVSDFF